MVNDVPDDKPKSRGKNPVPVAVRHFRIAIIEYIDNKTFNWFRDSFGQSRLTYEMLACSIGLEKSAPAQWTPTGFPLQNLPLLAMIFDASLAEFETRIRRALGLRKYLPRTRTIAMEGCTRVCARLGTLGTEEGSPSLSEEEFWWLYYLTTNNNWINLQKEIPKIISSGLDEETQNKKLSNIEYKLREIYKAQVHKIRWHTRHEPRICFEDITIIVGKWGQRWARGYRDLN